MDPAAFRDLEHELASSAQVRDQLRNSTAKEFVIYDEARSMYEAQRDACPGARPATEQHRQGVRHLRRGTLHVRGPAGCVPRCATSYGTAPPRSSSSTTRHAPCTRPSG